MPLTLQITDAGRAALVNAGHDGTNAVRVASVGVSPTAIVAAQGTSALPGELKRIATIAGDAVAEDVLHMVVRDESADSYTLRSFALYLEDGTLFAAYGQPDPIMEKSAQALLLLAVDVALTDVSAAQVTFGDSDFLNPPATTDRQGVVELADDAEMLALADKLRAVTPAGLAKVFTPANILSRLLQVDGAGCGIDADLLDGRDGTYYGDIVGRLGYTPVNKAGDTIATGVLGFGALSRQMVNLYTDEYGIGVQTNTAYLRTTTEFAVHAGGTHADAQGNPGIGGTNLLRLSGSLFTYKGNSIWHAANDGSGSGSDSDMLDGRHAAEFALLTGAQFTGPVELRASEFPALGLTRTSIGTWYVGGAGAGSNDFAIRLNSITPALILDSAGNASFSGAIFRAGSKVWDAGNDGSGSGSDADMLDGHHAAEFVMLSGGSMTGALSARYIRGTGGSPFAPTSGAGVELQYGNDNGYVLAFDRDAGAFRPLGLLGSNIDIAPQGGQLTRSGNMVWDAGNDGSGSGCDADMVDGWHRDDIRNWGNLLGKPTSFPPSAHSHGAADIAAAFPAQRTPNGYAILPNGLILQWGQIRASYASEVLIGVAFPTSFPTACLNAQATGFISSTSTARDLWPQICGEPSTSGMVVQLQSDDSDNWSLQGFNWWAVGY